MLSILIAVHMLIAVTLIGMILIQRGKGADIGAAFGSGASQTVFGSQGAASFLTRTTAVLATLFFVSTLVLAYSYSQLTERKSVTEMAVELPPAAQQQKNTESTPGDVPDLPQFDDETAP